MLVYIWRIWCTVESAYFEVESASAPSSHGGHAIDASRTAIVGFLNSDKAGTGKHVQAVFSEDEDKPYALIDTSSVWSAVGDFRFPGTNAWTPATMNAVMKSDCSSHKHDVRLYDVTHAKVVCQLGMTALSATPTVYSVTAFSNLPEGESVFEVQVKAESSSYAGKIFWVDLEG